MQACELTYCTVRMHNTASRQKGASISSLMASSLTSFNMQLKMQEGNPKSVLNHSYELMPSNNGHHVIPSTLNNYYCITVSPLVNRNPSSLCSQFLLSWHVTVVYLQGF